MTTGVLVMAYGTPRGPEEVATFYTDVRRGHPPSTEQLADLHRRYLAIGGVSPLARRTADQVRAIGAALEALEPSHFRAIFGARHADPKIEAAMACLAKTDVDACVGLVLAPHYARASIGAYLERASAAAADHAIAFAGVERWGEEPLLLELLAESVRDAVATLPPGRHELVVTAHSLPVRALGPGDRYAEEVRATAERVAEAAGFPAVRIAWQSAGRTDDEWLGPDLVGVLTEIAEAGADGVVCCPAGFTSDHLEVLYDLDIEARAQAWALGLAFARSASLNDDPRLAGALARLVAAADPGSPP